MSTEQKISSIKESICSMGDCQIFGLDRNIVIMIIFAGILLGLSFYMFSEIKKIKSDIRTVKSQEIPEDSANEEIIEKVEQNSHAILEINSKMEQLVNSLNSKLNQIQTQTSSPVPTSAPVQRPASPPHESTQGSIINL